VGVAEEKKDGVWRFEYVLQVGGGQMPIHRARERVWKSIVVPVVGPHWRCPHKSAE